MQELTESGAGGLSTASRVSVCLIEMSTGLHVRGTRGTGSSLVAVGIEGILVLHLHQGTELMLGFPKVRMAYSAAPKNQDPREAPVYSLAEAALFLGVPRTTLRYWTRPSLAARPGSIEPLIIPAGFSTDVETGKDVAWLSFYNLSEAHVLSSLTRFHGVKMGRVRDAVRNLEELHLTKSGHPHPLLSKALYTDGRDVFIKTIEGRSRLTTNLSQGNQLGFSEILDEYLERIIRDDQFNPIKIYPQKQTGKVVSMVLGISSGRPIVDSKGVPVASLWNRFKAGDSPQFLADDYEIGLEEVEGALNDCEQRAA